MKHLLALRVLASHLATLVGTLVLIVLVVGLLVGLGLVHPSGSGPTKTAAAPPGLYIGSLDGFVYKLNAQTGALRWSQQVGGQVTGMQVVNGVVYASAVSGEGHSPFALSVSTGKPIWHGQTENKMASAPVLADGVVCIVSDSLYAFTASNGHLLWRKNGFGAVGVAASGDLVFSAETDQNSTGTLDAFDARSGVARWQVTSPTPGWWFSGLVAGHGVVYAMLFAAQQGGYEEAFNASDGTRLWQSPLLNLNGAYNPPGAPLVVGGSMYLPMEDGLLIALDTRTGQPLWTYTPAEEEAATSYGGFSSLWAAGQVVYIGELGHITTLNASDGAVMQKIEIARYRGSPFLIAGTVLYVNTTDGLVHALKLADGSQVWQYDYFQPNQETGFDAAAMVLAA